ncbi:MAG: hypothetical protein R6X13_10565 [bacterium]
MSVFKAVLWATVLCSAAHGAYVVEWSASGLAYSMAYAYTGGTTSYDVTGDSIPEVFVTDSTSLKVYSGVSRSLVWTIPSGGYSYMGFPYVGNTDGDAAAELVLLCYSYSSGYSGRFYIYDCNTHNQEFASPVKQGYPSLSVADVDGDNKNEICIVSGTASRILEVYGSDEADIEEMPELPVVGHANAMPNPATGRVMLSLPAAPGGVVEITDVAGRVVRRLDAAGSVAWDCRDDGGAPVPAGVYLYRQGGFCGRVAVAR